MEKTFNTTAVLHIKNAGKNSLLTIWTIIT